MHDLMTFDCKLLGALLWAARVDCRSRKRSRGEVVHFNWPCLCNLFFSPVLVLDARVAR